MSISRLFRGGIGKKLGVLGLLVEERVPESEIKRILGIKEERKVIGYARASSYIQKD